jgi:uncharacterized membrane protein YeaQ/YmgE (transglycosylase-associated protein family)
MEIATPQAIEHLAENILIWVGYGTLVGLLAKAIMPGRDPGGAIATLAMGIGGSVIGSGVLSYFWEGHRVSPLSTPGFLVGTGGAFLLLAFYRLFAGYYFTEGTVGRRTYAARRRSRRPRREVIIEE